MKRVLVTVFTAILSLSTSFAGTQSHDNPHEKGFRLNLHFGLVNQSYGFGYVEGTQPRKSNDGPKTTFGLEIGNKWTFTEFSDGTMSVGLVVDWFDLGYSRVSDDFFKVSMFNVSALAIGPSFTYAINDELGVDLYYQAKPTGFLTLASFEGESDLEFEGWGINHVTGIGLRYKVFNFAVEPHFGNVSQTTNISLSGEVTKVKTNTSNVRFVFGFKF